MSRGGTDALSGVFKPEHLTLGELFDQSNPHARAMLRDAVKKLKRPVKSPLVQKHSILGKVSGSWMHLRSQFLGEPSVMRRHSSARHSAAVLDSEASVRRRIGPGAISRAMKATGGTGATPHVKARGSLEV